jgi:hypothetical protein
MLRVEHLLKKASRFISETCRRFIVSPSMVTAFVLFITFAEVVSVFLRLQVEHIDLGSLDEKEKLSVWRHRS